MHAPSYRRRLLIFVKEPVAGRVKTRLGREIGMVEAAWWFRRQALAMTRRLSADPRWETWLAVSPDRVGLESRFWPPNISRWPQGRGDLGARMGRAFATFPPGPLIIVGADILDVSCADIWDAFGALGAADAVFGPAEDGGYWLIGLARGRAPRPARLFDDVRWSTPHALDDTVKNLRAAKVAFAATRRDVDRASDLPHAVS